MINKMKGTYDLLPENTRIWNKVEKTIKNVCKLYKYEEIRTPIIEHSKLFHRMGEDSDVVTKETYDFKDRGNRDNTLRPEGTAGVVRSLIENKLYVNPFNKLYYMGPMFRYERQQKGRYRQFRQFGIEAFGSKDPIVDADVIAFAATLFRSLKIKDITIKVNSIGDKESKELYKAALNEYLSDKIDNLCSDCQRRFKTNPLRVLDCKVDKESEILKNAPKPIDYLTEADKAHFDKVVAYLDQLQVDYVIDSTLVRGLDYYTHTVFEVDAHLESLGSQNTVLGGGRYNNLVKELGGPEVPSVGFGLGMERLIYALESIEYQGDPIYTHVYLMTLGDNAKTAGIGIINKLRLGGLISEMDYLDKNMKGKWKQVAKCNARFVAILGDDELSKNEINLKDQSTGEQHTIKIDDLYTTIIEILTGPSHDCGGSCDCG